MKKHLTTITFTFLIIFLQAQTPLMKTIHKNGMSVKYTHHQQVVSIELSAPTSGWIAIGFNEQKDLQGLHLIMCRIFHEKPEVLEHHTLKPGKYQPITSLGGKNAIKNIKGYENCDRTHISFDVLISKVDKYHKELSPGKEYYVTLAYSQSDNYQHHSIMRTTIKSIL